MHIKQYSDHSFSIFFSSKINNLCGDYYYISKHFCLVNNLKNVENLLMPINFSKIAIENCIY